MKVEIWSDVICPWCYVGKRRFEAALAGFAHRDDVELVWRSFELGPRAPTHREGDMATHLARKYGMTLDQAVAGQDRLTRLAADEGLDFHFERARPGNTFDAHRLVHLGATHGRQDAVKERLLVAYFTEGEAVGDRSVLARLGADAGLDPDEVRAALDEQRYASAVRDDESQASRLGVTAVPFFVVDRRYGVAGAQPAEEILQVLQQAWSQSHPLTV